MFSYMKSYPTQHQIDTYNSIISQLEAAGVEPYRAIEKSYDAYKCINEKNIELAFHNNIKIRRK